MQTSSIFEERDRWSGAIFLSAALHVALFGGAIVAGYLAQPRGENWGGTTSGDAVQANLISAVPLPQQQQPTQNIVANESKGKTQSVPEKVQEEQNAVPIPEREVKRPPKKTAVTQAPENPRPVTPPQDNVVPYGQGGPISGPYGVFKATNVKGGFSFQSGDFGSRYGWYVQVVNSKVSNNWYTVEVGQGALGHRVYILFDIERDGSPSNVRIEQSSGIPALDQSAVRAVQRIDTFGPPPSGNKVSVEFWFDYQR
ncbi:MAG TPA: TonB family protein [Candidatus Angelobacter sp.]